jgi:hypothetical protein
MNRGRRLWPEFRRALAVALDEELPDGRLLTLEETEHLRERYFDELKHGAEVVHLIRPKKELDDLLGVIQRIATSHWNADAILLHQHDRFTGAVRVRVGQVLRNALRVWSVVGHDLFLTTEDARSGLCLEFNHQEAVDTYELHLWGFFDAGHQGGA